MAFEKLTNIEIEMSLIGAAISADTNARQIVDAIENDEVFSEGIHAVMISIIRRRVMMGETCAGHIMANQFADLDGIDALGGPASYVAKLASMAAPPSMIREYASELVELYQRRLAVHTAACIKADAENIDKPIMTSIAEAENELASIRSAKAGSHMSDMRECADDLLDAMSGVGLMQKTGFATFDRMTGGLNKSEMTIIAGRPAMGKSALAVSLAMNIAEQGKPVAFFSLEMPKRAIMARMIASRMHESVIGRGTTYRDILTVKVPVERQDMLVEIMDDLKKLPVMIDDRGGTHVSMIVAEALQWHAQTLSAGMEPGMVIVDHIGLVRGGRADPYQAMTFKSATLMALSRRLQCPLVVLSQLSRAVESRKDKRPMLSDLRDSGALEQDATMVIFPYRGEYYIQQEAANGNADDEYAAKLAYCENTMDLIVAKNRHGATGTVRMFCDISANRITDLETGNAIE